ncbi:TetR family transcriptional regulator [Psychrosphaera saromensis]|uniref:TetR family transcriptional regulator n=1 Tax=Psychrosphaera saromensis TaxID=716813 RepID=A0A2S7UZZ0_9GAMM|nr:TetR/AcrR family transcriptional regulator [Psychrosphaera saromensis]PQJ54840.1 TetR family transcriptional regulator [Psychrosphaera saromensis]GHB56706.1 TetR family transcriptional regulator [Psychrosphaera saromensis]GLQ13918.1 TetR family transcriptional regulator [Psychrosphaera saromensis]
MASGRKKSFKESEALVAAMEVFWAKGYVGASLSDLTHSMGINKPSMYSTFGNKEALFIQTTQLYIKNSEQRHSAFLFEENLPLAQRIKNHMASIVLTQCETGHPKGCYLVLCQSELVGGGIPEAASEVLNKARVDSQKQLTEFFQTDPESIKLGLNKCAAQSALCIITTLRGTATMARAGSSYTELEFVIDNSLRGIGLLPNNDQNIH